MGILVKICFISFVCIYMYADFTDSATVPEKLRKPLSFSDRCYFSKFVCRCVVHRRDPHCGSNGITYRNKCEIKCYNKHCPGHITSVKGSCESIGQGDATTTDEKTKSSVDDCMAQKPPCICTREFAPVCGSNNVTYSNTCQLKCAQQCVEGLSLSRSGPC